MISSGGAGKTKFLSNHIFKGRIKKIHKNQMGFSANPNPDLEEAEAAAGGGTYGLIVNRLALHRNRRTPLGGRLTFSVGTGRRKDRGGWRRRTAAVAAARGGRRGWRRFTTTYHPTISVARAHYTTIN